MRAAEGFGAAKINHDGFRGIGQRTELLRRERFAAGDAAERFRAIGINALHAAVVIGEGRHGGQNGFDEFGAVLHAEVHIGHALVAQRGLRAVAHSSAAHGTRAVGGMDFDAIGQRGDALIQTVVELLGEFALGGFAQ